MGTRIAALMPVLGFGLAVAVVAGVSSDALAAPAMSTFE